jgi:hypothetical protein
MFKTKRQAYLQQQDVLRAELSPVQFARIIHRRLLFGRGVGRNLSLSETERLCYVQDMQCVSGDRLASALAMRRPELWDSNSRLAERIEMRIKDAQRAHRQAHGTTPDASRCLAELHRELSGR